MTDIKNIMDEYVEAVKNIYGSNKRINEQKTLSDASYRVSDLVQ